MKQHSPHFLDLALAAKRSICEISPQMLKAKLDAAESIVLIDVREESEWPTGHLPNAIHLSKGIIERDIEKHIPDLNTNLVVYCSGGFRSALVAYNLMQMGYTKVSSLEGGLSAWVAASYPLT